MHLRTFTDIYRPLQTFTDIYRHLQTFTDICDKHLTSNLPNFQTNISDKHLTGSARVQFQSVEPAAEKHVTPTKWFFPSPTSTYQVLDYPD